MKEYKFILWDIDDTLIDFKASEKVALKKCFDTYGVDLTEEQIKEYARINKNYWTLLEQGKVEKTAMLTQRFIDFLDYLGVNNIDGAMINKEFQMTIGDHVVMFPGALELCKSLKGVKYQYAVTNGTIIAQERKLKNTGLDKIFDGVFISDKIGYQKPDIRFFEEVARKISNFNPKEALLIGDSLTSDMQGANNAGIDCCWFNPKGLKQDKDLHINYEVKTLKDLKNISPIFNISI